MYVNPTAYLCVRRTRLGLLGRSSGGGGGDGLGSGFIVFLRLLTATGRPVEVGGEPPDGSIVAKICGPDISNRLVRW